MVSSPKVLLAGKPSSVGVIPAAPFHPLRKPVMLAEPLLRLHPSSCYSTGEGKQGGYKGLSEMLPWLVCPTRVKVRASVVVQQVKPPPAVLASHNRVVVESICSASDPASN